VAERPPLRSRLVSPRLAPAEAERAADWQPRPRHSGSSAFHKQGEDSGGALAQHREARAQTAATRPQARFRRLMRGQPPGGWSPSAAQSGRSRCHQAARTAAWASPSLAFRQTCDTRFARYQKPPRPRGCRPLRAVRARETELWQLTISRHSKHSVAAHPHWQGQPPLRSGAGCWQRPSARLVLPSSQAALRSQPLLCSTGCARRMSVARARTAAQPDRRRSVDSARVRTGSSALHARRA